MNMVKNKPTILNAPGVYNLGGGGGGGGNITPFTNAQTIRIPNWGEWYEINKHFGPWQRVGGDNTSQYDSSAGVVF